MAQLGNPSARRWLAIAAVAACTQCDAPTRNLSVTPGVTAPPEQPEALLGTVRYGGTCKAVDTTFLEKALHYGRTVAASTAFGECVDAAVRNTYKRCNGDPYYDANKDEQLKAVLAASRSSVDLAIECTGGNGNASAALGTYAQLTAESLAFSSWLQAVNKPGGAAGPWPWSQAAGIIWHEAMHQQGYTHGANDQKDAKPACGYPNATDAEWHYQVNTLPYIVGDCIALVLERSGNRCGAPLENNASLNLVTHYDGAECALASDPHNATVTWQQTGHPLYTARIASCSDGDGRIYAQNDDRTVWVSRQDGADNTWTWVTTPGSAQQIFCANNTLWAFNDDRTLWRNDGTDQNVQWTYVGKPWGAKQVTGTTVLALIFPAPALMALNDDNTLWRSPTGEDGTWVLVGKPWAADRIAVGGGLLEQRPFALNGDKTLWLNSGDGCDAYWHFIDYPFAAAEITAASMFKIYALNTDRTLWVGKVNGSSWLTPTAFGKVRRCDNGNLAPLP